MPEEIACPRCQIGNLQAGTATYTYVYNGMLLSVPGMPAWTCDLCQYQEFDYDAVARIEALVGHVGMPSDPARPASKLPAVDADLPDSSLPHRIKP